ncbi:MAG: TDP-N-acetylfucosamine:lipid II N-acetylfucosaminyltransferase [Balneolaceae bacterium]|nr:TDP-N-acetylfucosamine:lipid II N-acetylfucosaminyltransferase [Balneolaceae bacterium]
MSNPPKIDEALSILNKFRGLNHPSAWVISYLTGFAYVRKEDFESAVKPLEQAIKKGGNSYEVLQILMEACIKTNRFERAKVLIEQVLNLKEDDVAAWKNLAIVYTQELKYEEAIVTIGKANNFDRTNLALVVIAGNIYGKLKKYDEAINTFDSLIQVQPDYLDAHIGKTRILINKEHYAEAKQIASKLMQHVPENSEVRSLMAACQFGMGEFQQAITIYDELVTQLPADESLVASYAECLLSAGMVEEAKVQVQSILASKEFSKETLAQYARILKADENVELDVVKKEISKYSKQLPKAHQIDRDKPEGINGRKLKLGIISNALWDHPVGRKWEKILSILPKELFKVVAFSTEVKKDAVADNIASNCSVFHLSHQISPVALTDKIRNLNLDFLIDASANFDSLIEFVMQHKPSAICISSNDRELLPFEVDHYDFGLGNPAENTFCKHLPTHIVVSTGNALSISAGLIEALKQASASSQKQWKKGRWQQPIDAERIADAIPEIEEDIQSFKDQKLSAKVESGKIFNDLFWNGFTDSRKANKIAALTKKFFDLNQTADYLQQIVDETAKRLQKEPTDNVAFYIQTIALLAQNAASIKNHFPVVNEVLEVKGWMKKLPLYSYWFEKVEEINASVGTKVSAIIISNKFKEKSVENLKQLSKQLKGIGEIIFVNNGVEDEAFSALFPYVNTYVKANGNAGAYLARNLGAAFAKGEYLLFVDDDGIPQVNFVQAHLKEHAERDIIVSRGMYYSSNVINDPWHYNIGNTVIPAYTILEGNAMYKAEAFYKAGGWGDYILFGHGGKDLSFRLLEHYPDREQQIYVPQSRLHHEYLRGAAHQKEKKLKQEVSLRLLEAMHPGLKQCMDSWPTDFTSKKAESTLPKKSLLPIAEGKKSKYFHFCRNHVYAQALSDMIEELNATSDQQHWLLVEKTPWNVAGGYTIEEGKNASTLFFDCSSQSDVDGIINELLLPEVTAVFMHGMFRAWEHGIVDVIGDKKHVGWMIWGGDLYQPLKKNQKRRIQHHKLGSILTPVDGDAKVFHDNFGDKPRFDFAYPYPGLYGDIDIPKTANKKKILVGNSGDPSNNHIHTLHLLSKKKDIAEYQIIIPLAYNCKPPYKQELLSTIDELGLTEQVQFHEQFILPDDYMNLINDVDMLIMAHDRQQAIGNTLMGLFLGKQIFIKDKIEMNDELVENPSWQFLHENGLSLQSLDHFSESSTLSELPKVDTETWNKHQEIIRTKFGLSARANTLKNSCDLISEMVNENAEINELQPA